MTQNNHLDLIKSLEATSSKLDHNRASWINKHLVINLAEKSRVLLESITRLENNEKQYAINAAANHFLIEVKPVIELLDKGEQ